MESGSIFLFLQEQSKGIIIIFCQKMNQVKAEDRGQKKDRGQFFSFSLKDNAFPSS
jgi:hypothetical protein